MKIIFIRHGESMGNVWDGAYWDDNTNFLSLRGMKQAELASYDIRRIMPEVDEVFCSEVTRARQTATIIMQSLGDWKRHYIQDPRLNEWGHDVNNPDEWPGHSSQDVFRAQVNDFYEDVLSGLWNTHLNILLVSHYYTMTILFERIHVELGYSNGYVDIENWNNLKRQNPIPNAIPFFFDTLESEDIEPITPVYFEMTKE